MRLPLKLEQVTATWLTEALRFRFPGVHVVRVALNRLLLKGAAAVGVFWGVFVAREPKVNWENFQQLFAWYGEGKLKPHISMRFPLEKGPDAMNALLSRKATGKVVLTVA